MVNLRVNRTNQCCRLRQYLCICYSDCERIEITADHDTSNPVSEDDDVMISCVAECTQSQVFTLYTQAASLSEPTAVGQVPGNAALAVAAQRAHNDAVFYCDLDDWRVDIVSNNVSFTVLCKWIFFVVCQQLASFAYTCTMVLAIRFALKFHLEACACSVIKLITVTGAFCTHFEVLW